MFPIALFWLFALSCLALCLRDRFAAAAVPAAGAALSYSTGFLLAPVVLATGRRGSLVPAVAVAAGFAAVMLVMWRQTGLWNAYFLGQSVYGYSFAPIDTLFSRLKPLVNPRYRTAATFATAAQTLLTTVLMTSAALACWNRRRDREVRLVGAYALGYWLLPLVVGGRISLYRSESLLLPIVALLRHLPRRYVAALAAAAFFVFLGVAAAFFRGTIV